MTAPLATYPPITVNVFTPSYRIVGKVQVANSGIIGVLNNVSTAYLEVREATMARISNPTKMVERVEAVSMVKHGITAVGLARREDVGPQAMARGGFGRLTTSAVKLITSTFEMSGTLEWVGRFDLRMMLNEGGDFVPLYDVTFNATEIPELFLDIPALLFHRRKVDMMSFVGG